MAYFRNRVNPNLYRYRSLESKNQHQKEMDDNGYEIYREWEGKEFGNRTVYYCEYIEIGRA